MANKGKFVPFLLEFKVDGKSVSYEDQAIKILDKARELIAEEDINGVAITYSANYDQTKLINKTYADGDWNTHTSGANQAKVMENMETLMGTSYADLQQKMRIAPITTMTYSSYDGHSHEDVIKADLKRISDLIENGWIVLGWINTKDSEHFAVGGGVSEQPDKDGKIQFPKELSDMVQLALKAFAGE